MPWHSTGNREELVIVLGGKVRFESRLNGSRIKAVTIQAGECVFVPSHTMHQVVNRSKASAEYLYVTAPISG